VPFARVWTNARWLAAAALLWAACTGIYFLTAPGRIDMFDGGIRHEVTESLIDIGVPAVRDSSFPGVPGRGGYRYAWYELGSSVTAIPLVMLASRLARGSLEARQFAFSMTSVPFAAATVALLFLIYGRLHCSMRSAAGWALAVGFGTMLWPYAGSSFDAALQGFWLTLAVWGMIEAFDQSSPGWAALSAVAWCMLLNVQESYIVLAGSTLAVYPARWKALRRRLLDPAFFIVVGGCAAGVLLVAAANVLRYGNPFETGRMITGGPHGVFGNPLVGLAGLFISPAKSVFLYSPPAVIAIVGIVRLIRRDPQRFAPVGACLVLHLALISILRFWHGEWAWGPRYLVATLPLASIGLPFAWRQRTNRRLAGAVCAAGVLVQLLAISVDHQKYYFDRSFAPFFWMDESTMYTDSPLLARPREVVQLIRGRDLKHAQAYVPGPRPFSMTSSIFGPAPPQLALGHLWTRQYLVFDLPRPWPLWSRHLPPADRPGDTTRMTIVGCAMAVLAMAGFVDVVLSARRAPITAAAVRES
jgi:hypothetical protein